MILAIRAYGRPAPQGSKKLGGAGQLREASNYLPAWHRAVLNATFAVYADASISPERLPLIPRRTPVIVEQMLFYVTPEQCRCEGTEEPLGEPDVDKLLRAVLDSLGGARSRATARLYEDDSQVLGIRGPLWKYRATAEQPPGALIVISDGRD